MPPTGRAGSAGLCSIPFWSNAVPDIPILPDGAYRTCWNWLETIGLRSGSNGVRLGESLSYIQSSAAHVWSK